MKYTRYEYKKHGRIKFMFILILIIVLSITVGTYFSKFIFNNENAINTFNDEETNKNELLYDQELIALQFGYYSNKENADSAIKIIPSKYNSYIVKENDHFRVVIGLYSKDEGENQMKRLVSEGINVVKIKFSIPKENVEQNKVAEIISAFLKINNALEGENVKSVKTADYKNWCLNVINNEDLSEKSFLKEFIEYINNLPDEIDKSNISEYLKYFYEKLKNIK